MRRVQNEYGGSFEINERGKVESGDIHEIENATDLSKGLIGTNTSSKSGMS